MAGDQVAHIRHPPIPVPESSSPFASKNMYAAFLACLRGVRRTKGNVKSGLRARVVQMNKRDAFQGSQSPSLYTRKYTSSRGFHIAKETIAKTRENSGLGDYEMGGGLGRTKRKALEAASRACTYRYCLISTALRDVGGFTYYRLSCRRRCEDIPRRALPEVPRPWHGRTSRGWYQVRVLRERVCPSFRCLHT